MFTSGTYYTSIFKPMLFSMNGGYTQYLCLSGRKEDLSEETKQVLRDFANVSAMQADMQDLEDSNDNEADLTELVEYARLSAMMLYSEHHDVQLDAEQRNSNLVH